ncbi:MAG: hypothetical protein COV45_09075 [Deltaproteobacteria bacterium CG11_big_fil_rev_8_21_14_0_20_47_16]|nr:MAG: hypothetical protein COV45_09075 [Deltaproteobacteria bacterium CG11_big_fil_rev_8_21_14_0_20_47_16]
MSVWQSPFVNVTSETYSSAETVGSWTCAWNSPIGGFSSGYGHGGHSLCRPGEYQPGWANRFFNNDAPTPQQSREYDRDPGTRAQRYVNAAYSQKWNQQLQKWEKATAYDAYSSNQHAARSEDARRDGTEGYDEEMMWLADSSKEWMNNDQKRMDFFHAVQEMGGTPYGNGVKAALANLIAPGSTSVTDDVGGELAKHLRASEKPAGEKTADAYMNAYIAKLGGEAKVWEWLRPMLDAVWQQAQARGGYSQPQSTSDYKNDLRKKGLSADEAAIVADTALAGKKDYNARKIVADFTDLTHLPNMIGDDEKKRKRHEQICVAGLKALGVSDDGQINKYYAQIQEKIQKAANSQKPVYDFAAFMKEAKRMVDAGEAPSDSQSAAASPAQAPQAGAGHRGGRGHRRTTPTASEMQKLRALAAKQNAHQPLTPDEQQFVANMQRRFPALFEPAPAAPSATPGAPASGGGTVSNLLNGARNYLGNLFGL